MNPAIKKILLWTISILGIGFLVYVGFLGVIYYQFTSGCGMDDGPFEAVVLTNYKVSDSANKFKIENGELFVDNRNDTLSPIITLVENGNVKWSLDTDTRNTEGYENTRIWKISNVQINKNTDPIRFSFTGHWTYGAEHGSMKINRGDGENDFCLSW